MEHHHSEAIRVPDVFLGGLGTAIPAFSMKQSTADRLLTRHYASELTPRAIDVMHKVLTHPSIRERHLSVSSIDELLSLKNENPDKRIDRFVRWAVKLSAQAARAALQKEGVAPGDISALVVNTCTGYVCPGIATYLIEELGLPPETMAHDLVGSGCAGAVPNIKLATDLIAGKPDGIALSISVEICSATFEMGNDISLIVSNAIFGDGASAALLWHRPRGMRLVGSRCFCEPKYREDVRYVHRQGRLHNQISTKLPDVIGDLVPQFIERLLDEHQLQQHDIDYWAIHPGGMRMMDQIQQRLGLSDTDMYPTRETYARFGNMSSPTVLFAMDHIMNNGLKDGDRCLMVAYGAGLSIHGCIFQREDGFSG